MRGYGLGREPKKNVNHSSFLGNGISQLSLGQLPLMFRKYIKYILDILEIKQINENSF